MERDVKLYQRVAVLEEKAQTQEEAVDKLVTAVENLTLVLENSKGSIKMLGWIIASATTFGTLLNWAISLWHKN